jgi:hypothetical protein
MRYEDLLRDTHGGLGAIQIPTGLKGKLLFLAKFERADTVSSPVCFVTGEEGTIGMRDI